MTPRIEYSRQTREEDFMTRLVLRRPILRFSCFAFQLRDYLRDWIRQEWQLHLFIELSVSIFTVGDDYDEFLKKRCHSEYSLFAVNVSLHCYC